MLLRFIKFHIWPVMMMALFYFVLKLYRRHLANIVWSRSSYETPSAGRAEFHSY